MDSMRQRLSFVIAGDLDNQFQRSFAWELTLTAVSRCLDFFDSQAKYTIFRSAKSSEWLSEYLYLRGYGGLNSIEKPCTQLLVMSARPRFLLW